MFSLSRNLIRTSTTTPARFFSVSAARFIQVGDAIPNTTVYEKSPGNQVNLAEETASGKSVIVGVPGAFSPGCSGSHIPGFIKQLPNFQQKGYNKIFIVSVNDAFVQKAWGEQLLGSDAESPIKFIADPFGEFTESLDLSFDASKFFGNARSKRYALLVDNGVVTKEFVEPDNVGIDVSAAEKVLTEA